MAHNLSMLRFQLSLTRGRPVIRQTGAKIWHLVVTRNVILIGLVLAATGFILLRVALSCPDDWQATRELVKELGTTIFSLGVLALVWELFARRTFMREVLASVDLAEQVADSGLQQICWNYNQDIPWKELFERSTEVDLFFSYARTWRNNNYSHIEKLADRKGIRIRVVLPDHNDSATVAELARRFDLAPAKVAESIRESVEYFSSLSSRFPKKAVVECRVVAACPLMAIYLFSESAVLSLHSHQRKRTEVPTLQVEAKRPLYQFLQAEFESLFDRAQPVGTVVPSPSASAATLPPPAQPPVATSTP